MEKKLTNEEIMKEVKEIVEKVNESLRLGHGETRRGLAIIVEELTLAALGAVVIGQDRYGSKPTPTLEQDSLSKEFDSIDWDKVKSA